MNKEREYWLNIWARGVSFAKNGQEKRDNDYSIISIKKNIELIDKDLIKDKAWVNAIHQALSSEVPSLAFEYWSEEGWLKHAIPEIDALWGKTQPEQYHPEIDTGIHAMMVIDRAVQDKTSIEARWAALVHDFGKSLTKDELLPSHHGHEKAGVPLVEEKIKLWDLNPELGKLLLKVTEYHGIIHNLQDLKALSILNLIDSLEIKNNKKMLSDFCEAVNSDDRGRKFFFNTEPRNTKMLIKMVTELEKITDTTFANSNDEHWNSLIEKRKKVPNFSEEWINESAKQKFYKQREAQNIYDMIDDIKKEFYPETKLKAKM